MAANGVNGNSVLYELPPNLRFSDIPAAIDIPVQGADESEAVEVDLLDLSDDPTELCTLLENEGAPKHLWMIIALAYAKRGDVDRAIQVVDYGLNSLGRGEAREKLPLLSCKSCLFLWKARDAPRVIPGMRQMYGTF
jgi:RNA polymerase-associated protein CTR9